MADSITTLAVAAVASGVTYWIQIRATRLADAGAHALTDSRLMETIQLLLPALQSGRMMPSNLAILQQRIEKLDDSMIVNAYRKKARILQLIGQVQIAVARMALMTELGQIDKESTEHYAQVGIENALLAIKDKNIRAYAQSIATQTGFKPVSGAGPIVLSRFGPKDQSLETTAIRPSDDA